MFLSALGASFIERDVPNFGYKNQSDFVWHSANKLEAHLDFDRVLIRLDRE